MNKYQIELDKLQKYARFSNTPFLQELVDLYTSKVGKYLTIKDGVRPFKVLKEVTQTTYTIDLPGDGCVMYVDKEDVLDWSK